MKKQNISMHAVWVACIVCGVAAAAQDGPAGERFTAVATVKSGHDVTARAPLTITIDRKMPRSESEPLLAAYKSGGAAALREALTGVPPTGSVQLSGGEPTPTRLTVERATAKGRLLTIVTDKPILFLGGGFPAAKARDGYDFAVIDIEVDGKGQGAGSFAPAAKIGVKGDAFTVEDYASEMIWLESVSKTN